MELIYCMPLIKGWGTTNTNKFYQLLTGWGTYEFPLKQINIPETQTCVLEIWLNEKNELWSRETWCTRAKTKNLCTKPVSSL